MPFQFDEQPSERPEVQTLWRTFSASAGEAAKPFVSVATSSCELVFTRQGGRITAGIRGPETRATLAPVPEDAEILGVQLAFGSFLRAFPGGELTDRGWPLPNASARAFWLGGSAIPFPTFDELDVFVARLSRAGLLETAPVVQRVIQGRATETSCRTAQRQFRQATGLSHRTYLQILRAQEAVLLLELGLPLAEAAVLAGYSDQAHLTRALRRYRGQTPGQLARAVVSVQDPGRSPP